MNMEDSPLGAAVGSGDMGGGGAPEASRAGEITSNVKFSAEGAGFAAVAAYIQDIGQILMSVAKNPVLASMAGGRLGTTVERLVKHISGTGTGGLSGALQYLGTFLRRGSFWGVTIGATISQLAQIYNSISDIRKEWTAGALAMPERFFDMSEINNMMTWRKELEKLFNKDVSDNIERIYDAIMKYERAWDELLGNADNVRKLSQQVGVLSHALGEDVVNLLTQQFRSLGEAPPLAIQRIAQMALTISRSKYDAQSYIETINRLRGETRLTGGTFESAMKAVELFSDKLKTAGGMAAWTWGDFSTFVSGAQRIFGGGKGTFSQRYFLAQVAKQNFENLPESVREELDRIAAEKFKGRGLFNAPLNVSSALLAAAKELPMMQGLWGPVRWEALGFDIMSYNLLARRQQPLPGGEVVTPRKILGADFYDSMEKVTQKLKLSQFITDASQFFKDMRQHFTVQLLQDTGNMTGYLKQLGKQQEKETTGVVTPPEINSMYVLPF